MSGLTPTAFGNEPSGLQDVLAFIADFEMEDAASSGNHISDDWMEDNILNSDQQGHANAGGFPELFEPRSQRASTLVNASASGSNERLLLSTNKLGLDADTSQKSTNSTATKAPRRHRVSRKEELEYLRKTVSEMEDRLKRLKSNAEEVESPSSTAKPSTPEDDEASMHLEQSIALWKKMAERQKSQREMVESENAKLRDKLKTQVRMAKSLQRILTKRERAAEELSPGAYSATGGEFDHLLQSIDALYALTNERIALCPVASASQPQLREQDVKYNDFTGMFLEFQHSKLLPFDIAAASRATWRHMSEPGIKFNTYFEEVENDVVLRKFGVEVKQGDRIAKLWGRQAIQRYVESDRIVIVRNSNIDRLELPDASTGGLAFRDVGWLVLKDVTGLISASGPMTLLQSYSTLTPDIDLDAQWEVGALTDFVLQSREEMEVGNESIVPDGNAQAVEVASRCKWSGNTSGLVGLNLQTNLFISSECEIPPDKPLCLLSKSVNMSLDLQYEPAELDDILAFVGGFGLEDGADTMKLQASSPNKQLEMSDDAWFSHLDDFFSDESTSRPKHLERPAMKPPGRVKCNDLDNEKILTLAAPAPVLKPAKKVSSRPRLSRKDELGYLRVKVKEMEEKLSQLQEKPDCDQSSPQSTNSQDNAQHSMHTQQSIALWKTLAERQKNQRELVEIENAKLREKLKTQVRMAKSLKRILCKRTRGEEQNYNTPKRSRPLPNSQRNADELFDDMLQCLDELYLETGARIVHSPKASISAPCIRKRDIKYSEVAGMFLEFQDSKLWPFGLDTVSRAQWRFLTETGKKFNKYIEEVRVEAS
ncbi:unnamed protein product [Phytophthora fragariaefolia]|uniref:Unnamed protein product n=1 Tax=Phytophthora fragariaefolia TaxID=1490495 RepID=A0A9W6Y1Z4_9STRA|nr:unnamed protein product [Phytophthora fragariaefolia]